MLQSLKQTTLPGSQDASPTPLSLGGSLVVSPKSIEPTTASPAEYVVSPASASDVLSISMVYYTHTVAEYERSAVPMVRDGIKEKAAYVAGFVAALSTLILSFIASKEPQVQIIRGLFACISILAFGYLAIRISKEIIDILQRTSESK